MRPRQQYSSWQLTLFLMVLLGFIRPTTVVAADVVLKDLSITLGAPDDWRPVELGKAAGAAKGTRLELPEVPNDPRRGAVTLLVESLATLKPEFRTLQNYAERCRERMKLTLPGAKV